MFCVGSSSFRHIESDGLLLQMIMRPLGQGGKVPGAVHKTRKNIGVGW
jgi:hypothetical protein